MSRHARHRALPRTARHRAETAPILDPKMAARTAIAAGALAVAPIATAAPALAYTPNGDGSVTVTSGDTISKIAAGTGTSTQAVLDANGLGWSSIIRPGQRIVLPGAAAGRAAPAASRSEARAPIVQAASSSAGARALDAAKRHIGTPYRSGGTTPGGFDCSGLVQYAFAQAGVSLPRTSSAMRGVGTPVSNPQVGDLVFINGLNHVGIYAGNGQMIDSPRSGKSVSVRAIWTGATYRRV